MSLCRFAIAVSILIVFVSPAWASASESGPQYKACLTWAAIRSLPDPSAPEVGRMNKGESVTGVEMYSYWIRVRHGGVDGWVPATGLCREEGSAPAPDEANVSLKAGALVCLGEGILNQFIEAVGSRSEISPPEFGCYVTHTPAPATILEATPAGKVRVRIYQDGMTSEVWTLEKSVER